jgi:hypothetical protein
MTACYWIIGIANKAQAPAVAIDLHNADGSLARETKTITLDNHLRIETESLRHAKLFCAEHGVTELVYDPDSTQAFAEA